jgi:hypothetical protein
MYAPQDQPRGLPFAQASRLVQPPTLLWGMVFLPPRHQAWQKLRG